MTDLERKIKEFIKESTESEFEGCRFINLEDSFWLVSTKDNFGTTLIKIAENIDDLQRDYDWDFVMPTIVNSREVYDTESAILKDDYYLKKDSEKFYNEFVGYYKNELKELLKLKKAGKLE